MESHIKKVTCITDNFGDGQKIVAAEILYDKEIDGSWISAASFWVKGRHITGIEVNECQVKLLLDPKDAEAALIMAPGKPKSLDEPPVFMRSLPKGGPPKGIPAAERKKINVIVRQVGQIKTVDGEIYEPCEEDIISTEEFEPVIREFKQFEYKGISYNLFVPEAYDGKNELPMVVFIHDAGPCGPDPLITLSQGSGAVSFAAAEWQSKNPCFVLAPQIDRGIKLTSDNFQAADELEIIKELIDDVAGKWNIDKKRIYATGQSMGCMAFCEMNIRYPEFFAASLLVAGQWSPEKMAEKCSKCKFWILVSEHDARAFPGMNAVTEAMENAGVKVGRYYWDAKESAEKIGKKVYEAMNDDVDIRYTVFKGSSVVPPHRIDSPGDNHTSTWNKVYQIKALKEWLFANSL